MYNSIKLGKCGFELLNDHEYYYNECVIVFWVMLALGREAEYNGHLIG